MRTIERCHFRNSTGSASQESLGLMQGSGVHWPPTGSRPVRAVCARSVHPAQRGRVFCKDFLHETTSERGHHAGSRGHTDGNRAVGLGPGRRGRASADTAAGRHRPMARQPTRSRAVTTAGTRRPDGHTARRTARGATPGTGKTLRRSRHNKPLGTDREAPTGGSHQLKNITCCSLKVPRAYGTKVQV